MGESFGGGRAAQFLQIYEPQGMAQIVGYQDAPEGFTDAAGAGGEVPAMQLFDRQSTDMAYPRQKARALGVKGIFGMKKRQGLLANLRKLMLGELTQRLATRGCRQMFSQVNGIRWGQVGEQADRPFNARTTQGSAQCFRTSRFQVDGKRLLEVNERCHLRGRIDF